MFHAKDKNGWQGKKQSSGHEVFLGGLPFKY